jgi:hypothetical protein
MSRRRCCCPGTGTALPDCTVFSDPFTRANNQDLGPDWLESAGTGGPFRVEDGKLAVTGAAGETVECLHTIPSDVGTGTGTAEQDHFLVYVSVGFAAAQDGDSFSVHVGDLAARVELQRMSATRGQLRIYDGDVCKGSRNVVLYPSNTVTVCVDGDLVHVAMGGGSLLTIPLAIVSSVVHLSADCVGTITADDFLLSEHYFDDAACPDCRNEDCDWFDDGGFPYGDLPEVDYTVTVGTGTAADGNWYYQGNNIRCDADGSLQVAVTSPRGIAGAVDFSCTHHGDVGAVVDFFYDSASSCFARFSRESEGYYTVKYFCGSVQYGPASLHVRQTVAIRLCWDGATMVGSVLTAVGSSTFVSNVALPEVPVAFFPRVEVSGLASGYVLLNRIVATKDGDAVEPPKACPECDVDCPSCEPGTYRTNLTLTLSGLTIRDFVCNPYDGLQPYAAPYGQSCPDPVTIPMLAFTGPFALPCSWYGVSEAVVPAYHDYNLFYFNARLVAAASIVPVAGGHLLSVEISCQIGSVVGAVPAFLWMQFQETFLGDAPSCEEFGEVPFADGYQTDGYEVDPYNIRRAYYLACEFVTPQTCAIDPEPIHGTTTLTLTLSP